MATAALLLAVAGGVRSADDEIDTDLMQTVEDTNKSLASNIALQHAKEASSDAKELAAMFAQIEAFYVRKGNTEDAVGLSQKSRTLTADILRSVAAKDFDAATNSATTLARTCKACHNFYKKS